MKTITEEVIITYYISRAINSWIQDNRDQMYHFATELDREGHISIVVKEALKTAKKFIAENRDKILYPYESKPVFSENEPDEIVLCDI